MKLYEINNAIQDLVAQAIDPETGEILMDVDEFSARLGGLEMERKSVLEYVAKLALNTRASSAALKEEETRLKNRRAVLEKKEERLLAILDRECAGETTDLGVATMRYRKSERVEVSDSMAAVAWLTGSGHFDCCRTPEPEVSKTEVKKLLKAGEKVPGVSLVSDKSYSLK